MLLEANQRNESIGPVFSVITSTIEAFNKIEHIPFAVDYAILFNSEANVLTTRIAVTMKLKERLSVNSMSQSSESIEVLEKMIQEKFPHVQIYNLRDEAMELNGLLFVDSNAPLDKEERQRKDRLLQKFYSGYTELYPCDHNVPIQVDMLNISNASLLSVVPKQGIITVELFGLFSVYAFGGVAAYLSNGQIAPGGLVIEDESFVHVAGVDMINVLYTSKDEFIRCMIDVFCHDN